MTITLLIPALILTLGMAGQCNPNEPSPPEEINTYVGVYEKRSICRLDKGMEICVDAGSKEFDIFVCVSNEHYTDVLDYVSRLRTSCEKWKPKESTKELRNESWDRYETY
jgi:hypothetical protein